MADKKTDNVVSLFRGSQQEDQAIEKSTIPQNDGLSQFEQTMRKNEENAQRLKDSRLKSNKSVIRSYRLKP